VSSDGDGLILPPIDDRLAAAEVAAAVARAAIEGGEARVALSPEAVREATLRRTAEAAAQAAGVAARAGVPWPLPDS